MTDNSSRRLPAEWETSGAVLLSWPHKDTDWAPMLDEVSECFTHIAEAITQEMKILVVAPDLDVPRRWLSHLDQSRIIYAEVPTNDTWARDFGPICVRRKEGIGMCSFMFNGWGLKFPADKDNLINQHLFDDNVIHGIYEDRKTLVLEGGSIDTDGRGSLLTTSYCLSSPNRNPHKTAEEYEDYFRSAFGVNQVLWLDFGYLAGDDTDSHVDTLARFAPNDTILYVKCQDPKDEHFEELSMMEAQLSTFSTPDGHPFRLIGLPLPSPIFDDEDHRLPATYANFLATPESVLLPIYGQPENDAEAIRLVQSAFPNHQIKPIDCRALIKQHGSLHCVTMQLPAEIL